MPVRDIDGVRIFIETEGEPAGRRPTVLFMHGLGGTTTFFEAQARALGATHHAVRFDLPGHGGSGLAAAITVESIADIAAGVLDSVGAAQAIVVGHSMGGIAAQKLAERHPRRVDRLILLGPMREQAPAARDATRQRAALVREKGMEAVASAVATAATSPRTQAERPEIIGYIRELLLRQDPEGYARACEALSVATAVPLAAIRAPALLIAGADDKVAPPALAEAMARELADTRLVVVEGCGHWTAIEAARQVNAAIAEFLAIAAGRQPQGVQP